LGSMLGGQAFHALRYRDGRTCALGAALSAMGYKDWLDRDALDLCDTWQLERIVNHPEYQDSCRLATAIIDLNNYCRWTREQIADWVETLEREQVSGDVASNQPTAYEDGLELAGVGVDRP
jgi:hypothetical protein